MTAMRHHPPEELLIDYAAGAATEGEATMIAMHLAGCGECRKAASLCETIGGVLLQNLEPVHLPSGLLSRTMSRLHRTTSDDHPGARPASELPGFFADRIGPNLADLPWHGIGGRDVYRLPGCPESEQLWLIRVAAGQAVPRHSHVGDEWTVVLEGGFSDDRGAYTKGDFLIAAAGSRHRPIADITGLCMCLVLLRAPLRFTNPLLRAMVGLLG